MPITRAAGSARFAGRIPRAQKRSADRTAVSTTPLNVRTSGVKLAQADRSWIERRAARQLGKMAPHIERITLRFADVNGPKGGKDIVCRAKVVLSGLPSVVAEERAREPREAFDRVSSGLTRAVRKAVDRGGAEIPRERGRLRVRAVRGLSGKGVIVASTGQGALIGRRVGQGAANLRQALERPEKTRRDFPVDTSLPGVSASDRKVGLRGTATRNTKLKRRGMVAALEDSATGKPSRKSTRRGANRAKAASQLERSTKGKMQSPKARATRAKAH